MIVQLPRTLKERKYCHDALKEPLLVKPSTRKRLDRTLGWVLALSPIILFVGYFLFPFFAFLFFYILAGNCVTEPMSRNTDLPGLVFEVTEKQCGLYGAVHFMTISVSRGPGILNWFEKTNIAEYQGEPEEPISVLRTDENKVRISVRATNLVNQVDRWQNFTFEYEILK